MRRARILASMLALAAFIFATPVAATTVTVQITGTWDSVEDTAAVLDGSITVGTAFTATLVFDDATPDLDPSPNVGDYLLAAATSDLVLVSGSYSFALDASSPISLGIDDNVGGQDGFGLFAEYFTTSGPLSLGASTGYGFANPAFFDNSQTAHGSDQLTALPWDASVYDNTNFYFLIEVLGKGSNQFIELSGPVNGLQVLPEPSRLLIGALTVAALVVRNRRG